MPAYNAEKFVARAITSILEQSYENFELLIADDASSDKTRKIIDSVKDPRIKCFHNQQNLGYLKACNKLMFLATGEFIGFQDADDYSHKDRIKLQMKEFEKDPVLAVCGTNISAHKDDGSFMFCSNYATDMATIKKAMLQGEYLLMPNSFIFKTEVLKTVGGYHEYFNRIGAEDYYWAWLIMERFKLKNIKLPLYHYTYNPNSVTGDWSDDIRKKFNTEFVPFILKTRYNTGTDPIETNDKAAIKNFYAKLEKPYKQDPSLYFRELAEKYFHEDKKKRAIDLLFKAILKAPLKVSNYKNLFYYLRNYHTKHATKKP